MMEMDRIDTIAASVLDGYLVRKDLVRTFSRQVSFQRIMAVQFVSYYWDALSAISRASGGIVNVRCIRSRKYS